MRVIVISLLCIVLGAAVVAKVQPPLLDYYIKVDRHEDTIKLPKPDQLAVYSLGYRAALADFIFAQGLVKAGLHFNQRTIFREAPGYLRAVVALDPRYRDAYRYADALLTLSTVIMPPENYRIAREIMTDGLKEFPDDAELWMQTGRFLAFSSVKYMTEDEDQDEWRRAGGEMMARGCALWHGEGSLPRDCWVGTNFMEKYGATQAAISTLKKLMVILDDPKAKAEAALRL
ncbi:MAG: hypothetical protein MK135_03455 [Polyangiaceae bacterium]|nr:hypothetical protein [Polyangiaceae bacterium]